MRPNSNQARPSDGTDGVDAPSGSLAADASQSTLAAIALSVTGATGTTSYLWSVVCAEPADSTYTSAAAPAAPTSASTTLTPDGPGDYVISCVLTGPGGSVTIRRRVTVTRPYPVVSSSLGATEELAGATYAPTLSETAGADAPATPWLTTALLVEDGSSVSVTGSTTTTPSFGSIAVGAAYVVEHTYTDAYGRVGRLSVGVRRTPGTVADNLTVALSTGLTVNQASPAAQAITATPTGGTGSKTYAWAAEYPDGSDASALLSATNVANPTLTTDDYAQKVIATVTVTDSGSPAQTATASVMVVVANTPIVFTNPAPQASTTAGPATVTFATATGGVGTLTPGTASLAKPATSGATLSGTGYGDFDFTTDVPGTYAVTQSVEDENEQTVQATGVVTYAPTGPTWTTLTTRDFASCDTVTSSSAGTLALTVSGAAYQTMTTYTSGSVTTPVWECVNGSGIRVTQAGGSGEIWMDFTPTAPASTTKVMAQFLYNTAPTFTGTTDIKMLGRLTNKHTWNTADGGRSSLLYTVKPGNYRFRTDYHFQSSPSETTAYDNASNLTYPICVTIIQDASQHTIVCHQGVSDFVNPDSVGTGAAFTYWAAIQVAPFAVYARDITPLYMAIGHLDAAGNGAFCAKARFLEAPSL